MEVNRPFWMATSGPHVESPCWQRKAACCGSRQAAFIYIYTCVYIYTHTYTTTLCICVKIYIQIDTEQERTFSISWSLQNPLGQMQTTGQHWFIVELGCYPLHAARLQEAGEQRGTQNIPELGREGPRTESRMIAVKDWIGLYKLSNLDAKCRSCRWVRQTFTI